MKNEHRKNNKTILGIILILVGGLLFLSNLDIIHGIKPVVFSWPFILLMIGIVFLFTHKDSGTGVVLTIIGAVGLVSKFYGTSFKHIVHEYWPAFLILFGIYLLFNKNNNYKEIK